MERKENMKLAGASDLTVSELNLDEIVNVIKNGRRAMIPYRNILSEDELNAVVLYSEGLKIKTDGDEIKSE